jgi:hypothetical protein
MSPFQLINRRLPRTSFDWKTLLSIPVEKLSQDKARAIATRMQEVLEIGKNLIKKAQSKKEKDVNKH